MRFGLYCDRALRTILLAIAAGSMAVACAPQRLTQQPSVLPPVRSFPHAAAFSARTFGDLEQITWVRVLPDGGALLNLSSEMKLVRLDSMLSVTETVLDSIQVSPGSFIGECLRPFSGDSSVFVAPNSRDAGRVSPVGDPGWKFHVLDAAGRVRRSIPFESFSVSIGCRGAASGFDRAGRFIHQGRRSGRRYGDGPPMDTLPILRLDPSSGRTDTLASIEVASSSNVRDIESVTASGRRYLETISPAYMPADEWAVTSDGAVAIIRWRDYSIEWVMPDGTRRSTTDVPWTWRRLSPGDKQRVVDSLTPVWAERAAETTRYMWEEKRGDFVMHRRPAPASEVLDYAPPFVGNRWYTRTDDVGNIWIRSLPTTPVGPGTLYDVIDRQGRMVDRVLFAPDRILLGVAAGPAYLSHGPLGAMRLERVVVGPARP